MLHRYVRSQRIGVPYASRIYCIFLDPNPKLRRRNECQLPQPKVCAADDLNVVYTPVAGIILGITIEASQYISACQVQLARM